MVAVVVVVVIVVVMGPGGGSTPKMGSGTVVTIGTNMGLYGLKLSLDILTRRDAFNGSTSESPRPPFRLNSDPIFFCFFGCQVPEFNKQLENVGFTGVGQGFWGITGL